MNVVDNLPEPIKLENLMKIHALLNIILCRDEWIRYHSFLPEWKDKISMAKIDNGAGDHLFILFAPQGTILKGFDHESELSPYARDEHEIWPGIYDEVPKELLLLLEDEAIVNEDVTFCIWRRNCDSEWQKGKVEFPKGEEDGSNFLLGTIFQTPEDFVEFAKDYFDLTPPLYIVANIYKGTPITAEMIQMLNPDCDVEEVFQELGSTFSNNTAENNKR
ncbi:hypothetical protein EJP77_01735 [Paenibacillus zeisoli]|uniref:Uncharacterized protein n=1 Tax=Paenibacillus zeisoli TaxID=2496267 RepID=A0A3S1D9K7_9BACL|nr:hypothetical protein [Paenibacillus zeisoli]RUT35764.1 hypothetical protein EJP77_01735 [Paenibacillus zeisoli]